MDYIDNLIGSITYQKVFNKCPFIKDAYDLFFEKSEKSDFMRNFLMNFFQKKFENIESDKLLFIEDSYIDVILHLYKENENIDISKKIWNFYPSINEHNIILFYGFFECFNKLWYSYYDLNDLQYIFVDLDANEDFINTYLIKENFNFDLNKFYFNKLLGYDLSLVNDYGYFCMNKNNIFMKK